MPPKAKSKPARPRVLITGNAGEPQISRSGDSVEVSKKLTGASMTQTFPRGKNRKAAGAKLIPAQDVIQVLEADATATAASSFAEAERRMAASIVEERQRKLAELQREREREKNKERMQNRTRQDTAIAKLARKKAKAARKAARERRPPAGPIRRSVEERLNNELGI